ncbi:MAG: hypothetical protein ACLFM0_06945 [Spirochaetales bacterium]
MGWRRRRRQALEYLKTIYRYDENSGAFIIDVQLPEYSHAFSQWESSWKEVREVAPGLLNYLKECLNDIPFTAPVELVFSVTDPRDFDAEEHLIRGIRNYFRYAMFAERVRIRRMVSRGVYYIGVAVALLAIGNVLDPALSENLVSLTLLQGLNVGGWVFMWEAMTQVLFQRASIRRTIADYARLYDAPIRFESS